MTLQEYKSECAIALALKTNSSMNEAINTCIRHEKFITDCWIRRSYSMTHVITLLQELTT